MRADTSIIDEPDHEPPAVYWDMLNADDKNTFQQLRSSFLGENVPSKNRHQASFQKDLMRILEYIDRRPEQQDIRSIVCGIFFGGSFVCVNTRQLKYLVGRCKSSINNGLQTLGYISSKTRVRQVIVSVLPALLHNGPVLRQWTLRQAEPTAVSFNLRLPVHNPNTIPKNTNPPPIKQQRAPFPTPLINMNYKPPPKESSDANFLLTPSSLPRTNGDFFAIPPPTESLRPEHIRASIPRPYSTPVLDDAFLNPLDDFPFDQTPIESHEPDLFGDHLPFQQKSWFDLDQL